MLRFCTAKHKPINYQDEVVMSVLDLPIEKQKELASRMGLSHSAWVEDTKKRLADAREFIDEVRKFEKEAKEKGLPVNQHMQDKFDSNYR